MFVTAAYLVYTQVELDEEFVGNVFGLSVSVCSTNHEHLEPNQPFLRENHFTTYIW